MRIKILNSLQEACRIPNLGLNVLQHRPVVSAIQKLRRDVEDLRKPPIALEFPPLRINYQDAVNRSLRFGFQKRSLEQQLLFRMFALRNIQETFQKLFASRHHHPPDRLDDCASLTARSEQNPLRVINRLSKIGHRAAPFLRRTHKLVTETAYDLVTRYPDHLRGHRVCIDKHVRQRIDDENACLDTFKQGAEPVLALVNRVVDFTVHGRIWGLTDLLRYGLLRYCLLR